MSKIFTKLFINILALYCSTLLFSGFFYNNIVILFIAGGVLWMINLFIRPLVLLISLPINLITVGLFTFIVNTWMLLLTDTLIPGIQFDSFRTALFVSLTISICNLLLKKLID